MKRIVAVMIAAVFGAAVLVPALAQAQTAPEPSKDTANPSAKTAPKADEGTGASPSKANKAKKTASSVSPAPSKDTANASDKPAKKAKKKTASSVSPAPSKDTANPSAKTAPKADEGTGANPSQKKAP
jgi:hypothetical protein